MAVMTVMKTVMKQSTGRRIERQLINTQHNMAFNVVSPCAPLFTAAYQFGHIFLSVPNQSANQLPS